MTDLSKCLTVKQAAKKLGVTQDWIRDLIQTKRLKATKIKQWRIHPKELERFIRSRSNL